MIRYKSDFIYLFLVLNILFDISIGFVAPSEYERTTYLAITRAIISIVFIVYVLTVPRIRKLRFKSIIYPFFIYLLFLIPFSSEILVSFTGFLKIFITFIMLPIGYKLIKTEKDLKNISIATMWIMFFIVINFIVSNIFKIGHSAYSKSVSFYAGNLDISALNSLTMCLLLLPLILYFLPKNRVLIYLLGTLTFIFLLLSMKRISIIALIVGIIIYLIFTVNKTKFAYYLLLFVALIIMVSPIYENILDEQLFARQDKLQIEEIEKEKRYKETFVVIDEILYSNSTTTFLFGKELFNSIGNYAGGTFGSRALHTTFAIFLHGTGLVGLILFILIHIEILVRFRKVSKLNNGDTEYQHFVNLLKPIFYALYVSSMTILISGGVLGITHRIIFFFIAGAIIGFLEIQKKKITQHINTY